MGFMDNVFKEYDSTYYRVIGTSTATGGALGYSRAVVNMTKHNIPKGNHLFKLGYIAAGAGVGIILGEMAAFGFATNRAVVKGIKDVSTELEKGE